MRAELLRLLRFGLVGVSNTIVTFVAFGALTGIGLAAPAASALAFALGAANGFYFNRSWTFQVPSGGATMLARYVAVQALGAGLSAGGVALLRADLEWRSLAAEALVLPCVTLVTYTLSRRLVFGAPGLA